MTTHMFHTYEYRSQKRYMGRKLGKSQGMTVKVFITRLVQLNKYLPFSADSEVKVVGKLAQDEIKEILYHTMPHL